MKALLILMTVLVLLPVGGDAKREKPRVIVVRDYTSAAWDGVIAQTVADFNAVMPKGGPKLVYERMGALECSADRDERIPRVVTICSSPELFVFLEDGTQVDVGGLYRGVRGGIWLSDAFPTERELRACHEFMHALTGVKDNYGALPDQSCVHGYLSQPGPFDVDLLREAFKEKHRSKPRHGPR